MAKRINLDVGGAPMTVTITQSDRVEGTLRQLMAYTGADYMVTWGLVTWMVQAGIAQELGTAPPVRKGKCGLAKKYSIPRRLTWTFEAKK